jgi:hypothetical protein
MEDSKRAIPRWLIWLIALVVAIGVAMVVFGLGSDRASAAAPPPCTAPGPCKDTSGPIEQEGGIISKAGGVKCKTVRGWIVYENFLGFDLLKTKLRVYFCWNGNKVTEKSTSATCEVFKPGAINGWNRDACDKWGFFKSWQGSNEGAFEAHAKGYYKQTYLGWTTNTHTHNLALCVFGSGGVTKC